MKRKGPTFGHVKFEYRLDAVFRRAIKEFREADAISEAAEKEYKVGKEAPELLPKYFSAQQRKMETGVVVIMAAGALLEQVINDYAHTFLDSDCLVRHLCVSVPLWQEFVFIRVKHQKFPSRPKAAQG